MDLGPVDVRVADGVLFVYNMAVVLSGAYIASYYEISERLGLLAIAVVIALFWTVYFRYSIRPRLVEELPGDAETS